MREGDPPPQLDYAALFQDPGMFDSSRSFTAAGFDVKQGKPHKVMVARHPLVDGYLFKRFSNRIRASDQVHNYKIRLKGAQKIQKVIDRHQLSDLEVPGKWLVDLSRNFAKRGCAQLLVVERIDILSTEETARAFQAIAPAVLEQLCQVLYKYQGFDSAMHNVRFTSAGKIAFIDTESWERPARVPATAVFKYIDTALTRESRDLVRSVFSRLKKDREKARRRA